MPFYQRFTILEKPLFFYYGFFLSFLYHSSLNFLKLLLLLKHLGSVLNHRSERIGCNTSRNSPFQTTHSPRQAAVCCKQTGSLRQCWSACQQTKRCRGFCLQPNKNFNEQWGGCHKALTQRSDDVPS